MAKSSVTITFNSLPQSGDQLDIENSLLPLNVLSETFLAVRDGSYKSKIGTTIYDSAYNYYLAISADYNGGGLYLVSYSSNTVTIEATQSNVVFTEAINSSSGRVTTSLVTEVEVEPITIDSVTFSQADSDFCNYVKVSVLTNTTANSLTSPLNLDSDENNPISFDWVRGDGITITAVDVDTSDSLYVATPSILSLSNLTVSTFNTPSGANATINVSNAGGLVLQYSLDNINWQTSSSFNGLLEGEHTIYVKDQLGCSISDTFEITIFTPNISLTSAFSYLGKEMSIRFKKNVSWDNFSTYKTEENTLSCEEKINNGGVLYPYYQKFQTVDIITTQFLSNYEDIEANVLNEDGTKDALVVNKKSENINIKDYRDATYYKYSDTQLGIYFTSGNKYDYTTGLVNGTYTLNGALPTWGSIGNYIDINGLGWFEIVAIDYDENLDYDILIVNYVYSGIPTIEKVGSIYNFKNYDVYEFDINFFNYKDKYIQVEILQSDSVFGEYSYLSEIIDVKETHEDTIELKWYNPTDTLVFYSTGLINKGRFDFAEFSDGNEGELTVHSTTDTTIMLDSINYEVKTLIIERLSTSIMRQLTEAFLHKEVYIDNVKYITNKSPESENVKNTNTYNLTVTLTKSGNVFNSEFSGSENDISNVEVIGLLQSNDNYINLN